MAKLDDQIRRPRNTLEDWERTERSYELQLEAHEHAMDAGPGDLTEAQILRRDHEWEARRQRIADTIANAKPATASRAIGRCFITGDEYAERALMLSFHGQEWLDKLDLEEFLRSEREGDFAGGGREPATLHQR